MTVRESSCRALVRLLAEGGAPAGEGADWEALLRIAGGREVDGLLYRRVRRAGAALAVPAGIQRRLREAYCMSGLRNAALFADLRAALSGLGARGVGVIVLKGAYLAEHVYADPALRAMADIDLLVRGSDWDAAAAVLAELGYSPAGEVRGVPGSEHHELAFLKPGATPIELHWTVERPAAPVSVDVEGLWARSVPVTCAGVAARRLGAADLLVHLCLHAAYHHGWGEGFPGGLPLRALFDISVSIVALRRELDWDRVAEIANRGGMGPYVYCALLVVRELTGAPVPAAALEALDHAPRDDAVARTVIGVLTADEAPPVPVLWRRWVRAPDRRDRLRLLLATLFPPPRRLREMYGLPAGARRVYAYYAVRPVDLLVRHLPGLARLLAQAAFRGRPGEKERLRIAVWLGREPPRGTRVRQGA